MNTNIHECFSKRINGNLMKRMYAKYFNAEAQRRRGAETQRMRFFSYCAFSVLEISAPPRLCASALKVHII